MLGVGMFLLTAAAVFFWIAWRRWVNPKTGQAYWFPWWARAATRLVGGVAGVLGLAVIFAPAPPTAASPVPRTDSAPRSAAEASNPTQDSPPVLPDLKWVDLTLNLEKQPYRFSFTYQPRRSTEDRCGSRTDPDTGADMRVCVTSYGDSVIRLEASVNGPGAKQSAFWLLPYVATAPFTGNDQAASKAWARTGIDNVRQGKPVTRQHSSTNWRLLGNPPTAYSLTISAKGLDAWYEKLNR